jgi:microsomal epoxide hydrolase
MRSPVHDNPSFKIPEGKAFGYSWFPYELAPMPRAWVETTGQLTWFRQHRSGGHFAAMEKPELLLKDVEEFLADWKDGDGDGKGESKL